MSDVSGAGVDCEEEFVLEDAPVGLAALVFKELWELLSVGPCEIGSELEDGFGCELEDEVLADGA